jgi:hypothetical protein
MDLSVIQPERRLKPRICCAFPAKVTSQNISGIVFDETTSIDNLSASGLHLRLRQEVPLNSGMAIIFRCTKTSPLGKGSGPLIAVEGHAVRIMKQTDGFYSVAVKILNHRFL